MGEKDLKTHLPFNVVHRRSTRRLVFPWTKPVPSSNRTLSDKVQRQQMGLRRTRDRHLNSTVTQQGLSFRHHPVSPYTDPVRHSAPEGWGTGHSLQHSQTFNSSRIYHQSCNCQASEQTVFTHLEGNFPQELLFLAGCVFGVYIWFIFSLCSHTAFLNNAFLDDTVEETPTTRCFFTKPPKYTPKQLPYIKSGHMVVFVPLALHSKVFIYLGEQTAQYNLEKYLFFLPTETPKSDIFIIKLDFIITLKL